MPNLIAIIIGSTAFGVWWGYVALTHQTIEPSTLAYPIAALHFFVAGLGAHIARKQR